MMPRWSEEEIAGYQRHWNSIAGVEPKPVIIRHTPLALIAYGTEVQALRLFKSYAQRGDINPRDLSVEYTGDDWRFRMYVGID